MTQKQSTHQSFFDSQNTSFKRIKKALVISLLIHIALFGIYHFKSAKKAPPKPEKIEWVNVDEPEIKAPPPEEPPPPPPPPPPPAAETPPTDKPGAATPDGLNPNLDSIPPAQASAPAINPVDTAAPVRKAPPAAKVSQLRILPTPVVWAPADVNVDSDPVDDLGNTMPEYPDYAKRKDLEGFLKIEVIVDTNGTVFDINILKQEGHDEFVFATREAAMQWTFMRKFGSNGDPVRYKVHRDITFKLR